MRRKGQTERDFAAYMKRLVIHKIRYMTKLDDVGGYHAQLWMARLRGETSFRIDDFLILCDFLGVHPSDVMAGWELEEGMKNNE